MRSRKGKDDSSRAMAVDDPEDDDVIPFDFARFFVTLFIVWQLLCVAAWLMPPSLVKRPFSWSQYYMWLSGSDQSWNMFEPNPASQDVYLTADITYRNGVTSTYTFPRMYDLNYIERYQQERFRKMIEWAHQDSSGWFWPELARFAALANNHNPRTNPVVHVDLVRHWQPIPNPGVPLPPYSQYTFYRVDYAPGSLNPNDASIAAPALPAPTNKGVSASHP